MRSEVEEEIVVRVTVIRRYLEVTQQTALRTTFILCHAGSKHYIYVRNTRLHCSYHSITLVESVL